jgi:excisionase family DNA binding protein
MSEASSQWMTTEHLAGYLATPMDTLLHWRKNAKGPRYHKFGRRVRYSKSDVDAWVESCAVGAAPAKS